jgi:hypothetical protein
VLLKDQSNNTGVPKSTITPFDAHNGPAATEAPAAKPAKSEDDAADPVKKIKKKGVSKYLQESFGGGGGESPGSAM